MVEVGDIKIVDMRKILSLTTGREGKQDVILTYMIGDTGPFMSTIPAEEIIGKPETDQNRIVKGYIQKESTEREEWSGRVIK